MKDNKYDFNTAFDSLFDFNSRRQGVMFYSYRWGISFVLYTYDR